MNILNKIRYAILSIIEEKKESFYKLLFVAYIGDILITNLITATVVYYFIK